MFKTSICDVYHFVHSDYKPDWHAGYGLEVDKEKGLVYVPGYNSDFFPVTDYLEKLKERGTIIPLRDYLVEIDIKLTELEEIE